MRVLTTLLNSLACRCVYANFMQIYHGMATVFQGLNTWLVV